MTATDADEPTPAQVAARRAQLVEALRSGRYAQATEALRTVTGYCCLGVAEDVRGTTWVDANAAFADEPGYVPAWCLPLPPSDDPDDPSHEYSVLTPATAAWYGLRTYDPHVVWFDRENGRYDVADLTTLNDTGRLPLAEIADVVADQSPWWDGTRAFATRDAARRNATEEDE